MRVGGAFLALWNDIRAGREPEYERWHTLEHVPERVAVEGMLGGRRYTDPARRTHRYLTLYEARGDDVFDGPEYRDLVDHPTPWSASMRPDFANVVRASCRVTASEGVGMAGHVAVLCHSSACAPDDAVRDALALPGVIACHAGEGSTDAPAWAAVAALPRPFDRVLLIEALDAARANDALRELAPSLGVEACLGDFGARVYALAFAFPGHDAASRARFRRAAWDAQPDPRSRAR